MPERLAGLLVAAAVWLVLAALWAALRQLFGPQLQALVRLFAPPHGHWSVLGVWAICAAVFYAGVRIADAKSPGLGAILLGASVALAAIVGLTWRDERRASRGLPPVQSAPLPEEAGWVFRILTGACALAGAAVLVWMVRSGVERAKDLWDILKLLPITLWLAGVAISGRWTIIAGSRRRDRTGVPPGNRAAT
jgi:hypothetical protein